MTFNSGNMPILNSWDDNLDVDTNPVRYEEFESLLASLYLTYKNIYGENSSEFEKANNLIEELAEHYKIQKPENTIKNQRCDPEYNEIKVMKLRYPLLNLNIKHEKEQLKKVFELYSML